MIALSVNYWYSVAYEDAEENGGASYTRHQTG